MTSRILPGFEQGFPSLWLELYQNVEKWFVQLSWVVVVVARTDYPFGNRQATTDSTYTHTHCVEERRPVIFVNGRFWAVLSPAEEVISTYAGPLPAGVGERSVWMSALPAMIWDGGLTGGRCRVSKGRYRGFGTKAKICQGFGKDGEVIY